MLGFHVSDCDAWLQVKLVGRPSYTVVVHFGTSTIPNEILDALRVWLRSPGDTRVRTIEVLPVM